jgi:hypothetical protein
VIALIFGCEWIDVHGDEVKVQNRSEINIQYTVQYSTFIVAGLALFARFTADPLLACFSRFRQCMDYCDKPYQSIAIIFIFMHVKVYNVLPICGTKCESNKNAT